MITGVHFGKAQFTVDPQVQGFSYFPVVASILGQNSYRHAAQQYVSDTMADVGEFLINQAPDDVVVEVKPSNNGQGNMDVFVSNKKDNRKPAAVWVQDHGSHAPGVQQASLIYQQAIDLWHAVTEFS